MKFYIKKLVCARCKLVVKAELESLGYSIVSIKEGEVEIAEKLSESQLKELKKAFAELDLELIDDSDGILIDKIKIAIIEYVYHPDDSIKYNLSDFISSKLGYSYNHLSHLFSSVHGTSIEKAFIQKKIERVKEILLHEKLTFSEIAYKVHYSSIAHLSSQFKKETGLTLSEFRTLNNGHD